jgi:hypothetical protein
MIKIHMNDGRVIHRETITVIGDIAIDGKPGLPVGLINYDNGRFLGVYWLMGGWYEHPNWRIFNSIVDAKQFNWQMSWDNASDFAKGLSQL